jgi:hypothetical protein
MNHVVGLSGGKDSTALALRLAEVEPRDYVYVCTPTGDEPDELFEHWQRLAEMLGSRIVPVVHPLGLNGLIEEQNALPNYRMRWCTRMLKIEPFRRWLATRTPAVVYIGLRADEEGREGGDYDDMPGVSVRYPLREWGWGVEDVWDYLMGRGFRRAGPQDLLTNHNGIPFPERTDCNRCFFQRLDEWHALWRDRPAVYADAEAQEVRTGHTFRSDGRDTQPAALAELRVKFEQGYVPKRRRSALRKATCRVCTL